MSSEKPYEFFPLYQSLTDTGKQEWDRLWPILEPTPFEIPELTMYCRQFERWQDAETQIAKFGTVIKHYSGAEVSNFVPSPFIEIAREASKEVREYLERWNKRIGLMDLSDEEDYIVPAEDAAVADEIAEDEAQLLSS